MVAAQQLIDSVHSGAYDSDITSLAKAFQDRLHKTRVLRLVSDYGLGDRVRFNDLCAVEYLRGHQATVIGIRGKKLVVKLRVPIGEFAVQVGEEWQGGEVVAPPAMLDPVLGR